MTSLRHAKLRHARLPIAATLAGVLLLTGCSGGSADSASGAAAENGVRAEADFAGSTELSVDAKFTEVEESDDARLLAPGVDLRITEIAKPKTLPADVYEDVTGTAPEDEDGEEVNEVFPAKGQVFYVAAYTSDDPEWEPKSELPESVAGVRLAGNAASELFTTSEGTMQRGVIVVSVPKDSSPSDAVIEVETDGASQKLSLINGTRVSTDVEQVYSTVGAEATIESAETIDQEFTGWAGDAQRLTGGVDCAFVAPWLNEEDGGEGWPGTGKIYLSVSVEWKKVEATTDDDSTMQITLDNGNTVKPSNDPANTLGSAFESNPVFEIPAGTKTVTVTINPAVTVGVDKKHSWDPITAEITIG